MNDDGITTNLIQDILNNVKIILNLTDTNKDNLLIIYINAICHNLLIKTNRKVFVEDLKYVVIDLVKNKYIDYLGTIKSTDDITTNQSIQSMSEAGRSVTFGATQVSTVLANNLNLIAQKQLEENEKLINKFKLLYKT